MRNLFARKYAKRLVFMAVIFVMPAIFVCATWFRQGTALNMKQSKTTTAFDPSEIAALEDTFHISLPKSDIDINKAELISGKDSILFAKIIVKADQVDHIKRSLGVPFRQKNSDYIVRGDPRVSWYKIDPSDLDVVLEAEDRTKLVFTIPRNGNVSVFAVAHSSSRHLAKEVYDMFSRKRPPLP